MLHQVDHLNGSASSQTLTDPIEEARRVVTCAAERGLTLRAAGGVGIALISPSGRQPPLARSYQDIDFLVSSKQSQQLQTLFGDLGYLADDGFNALHGERRLFFADPVHERQADIFVDRIEMCHALDLRSRIDVHPYSLSPADLLLSKLQVVETNEKDYKDAIAVLADHEVTSDESGININRINELCAGDWGWWRTVTMVAERTHEVAREMSQRPESSWLGHVPDRIRELLTAIESAEKSRRWKIRARVGDRVAWHETPEELSHE